MLNKLLVIRNQSIVLKDSIYCHRKKMFIAINYRRNSWSYSHHLSTYPVKIGIYNVLQVRSFSFNIICFRSDFKQGNAVNVTANRIFFRVNSINNLFFNPELINSTKTEK